MEDLAQDERMAQRNVIFFGPPGTGKSWQLKERLRAHLGVTDGAMRITFHPEYSYFDFVGTFRPVVGWLKTGVRFERAPNDVVDGEPRVYYTFDPGPLSEAIKQASADSTKNVVLIIEEINRGNCAAIFGDVFQLLDRSTNFKVPDDVGVSEYGVRPSGPWKQWLVDNVKRGRAWNGSELRLPRNLYLYATMNTSDQNLFPMDTAFRRRWTMEFVGIRAEPGPKTQVRLDGDRWTEWVKLMGPLNRAVVEHTGTDDKQMGPYFVKAATENERVTETEFASKVLFYLWNDVLRDDPRRVFVDGLTTYDELYQRALEGTPVFKDDIYKALGVKAPGDLKVVDENAVVVPPASATGPA